MTKKGSVSLGLMAALYIGGGINHLWHPAFYLQIMPHWLPYHEALVWWSGIAEIVLGVTLLVPKLRRPAAWGIILLLIAVVPANVQMALDWHRTGHPMEWIAWLRLPLQIPLILWAYGFTRRYPAVPRTAR